jgi:hypothetical protein
VNWRDLCEVIFFEVKWSEVKWSGITFKFLGTKVPCTLGWPYAESNLTVLWLFHLVCILYYDCFNLFCNVWVCICAAVLHTLTRLAWSFVIIKRWIISHSKPEITLLIPLCASTMRPAVVQWLRHCATNRKVAGSIPDGVFGIFHWHNPSGRTMALGLTQPLTEMSTRNISWG